MSGQPMEAAIGLGMLVSELSAPVWKDRVLTFESRPQWVDLSGCAQIADNVKQLQRAPWGGSTDFEAACEQILQAAQRGKLSPDEIPDLIVFSDMQFDCARGYGGRGATSWETHHERLVRRFAEVGRVVCGEPYAAPRIIYWNLRGNTVGYPVQADAPNTQMLSGFSPALLKLVLSGKDLVGDEKEVVLPDGTTKVRFANDLVARVKILTKSGCSNIELMELPEPMTKLAALEYLQALRRSGDEGYVIANKLQEKARVAKRKDISVTLKAGATIGTKTKQKVEDQQAHQA